MACSINLQDKAIRNIRVKRRVLRSLDEVLAEINSIPELSSYTLDKAVEEFTGNNLVFLQSILESFGYKYEGSKINKLKDRKPKSVTDIDSIFSSPIIDDLFDSLHIARQYFKNKATRMLSEVSTLNEKHQPTYTEKNSDLNKNIKRLKNELFETVVRFLKNNGVELDYDKYFSNDKFIATLYGTTWNFHNYNLYKEAIKALEQFLLGPNNENAMTTLSKHTIPNIRGDIRKAVDRSKFDAYNAAIMLANFDSIVTKFFGKTLTVDYSSFNDFSDGVSKEGKYLIKRKGDTEEYFSNGTHAEEGAQTNLDELSERVINMMSHYDRFGQETGLFLDTSDFYSLASFIREFERKNWAAIKWMQEQQNPEVSGWTQLEDNPTFMLKWYIDQILKADANGFDPKQFSGRFVSFKHRVDIIQSIKKFIEPLEEKEKNSKFSLVNVITQMLTNSYGANYMIFNAKTGELDLKEMHSHNALRVDIQNSIYSHLLDTYSDIDRYWSNIPESERFDKSGNSKTSLDALTTEKEIIAKQVDSDSKLSFYIKHLLGIYVGTHGASTLREKWGESLPTKLQDILKAIREKVNGKTLHEKILENETLIANQEYESAITPSTVIEEVSKNSGIQDILDVYLDNFILRPIMNIKTLTGEQIPTYKLANLMYSDTSLMLERYEIEKTYDGTYKNLFVNVKSDGLLGTSTGLEVINKDVNKSSSKLNIIENFNAYFKFGFIDSFRPGSKAKGIHTLIANYADKSTIMSKIISLGITHGEKLIIGKAQSLSEEDKVKEIMTMDEVLNLFRTQSLAFYTDLLNDIFDQYRKLNPELAKKLKSVEDNNPENFNHNINVINEYLGTFSSVDSFLAYASNMQKQDTSIKLTEELHYSFYNDKSRIGLNQTAVGYYQIFRDSKLFNEFVRKEEESFMNKLIAEKGEYLFNEKEIALMNKSFFPNGTGNSINVLLNAFGIKSEDYSVFSKSEGSKISITPKEGGFRINPILKRWMWTSNLFRNEYLNLSIKPEFMHPHKSKSIKFNGNTNFNDPESFFKEFRAESSKRIPNMSKRNVSFTATYENGLRNSRKGSPSRLNVAVIKDFVDQTYNLSGKTNKQDIHDGSSMIPYVYSRMIEESYPGKGYNGTKKRIATFITEFGSALKKDAETVITNDKIRRSVNSPIKLGLIQRKALGTIPLPTVNEFSRTALPTSGLYYRNGAYYKIHEYTLKDGYLTLRQSIRNPSTNSFELIPDEQSAPIKVNNLYDIWFAFGAESSVDVKADGTFGFSEGSNELLYDLIINANNNTGEYALKSGMIHIISNASAFKSGATNINLSSAWTDDNDLKLSYTTYNGRYIGPQLDAGHEADASKIKEITQIISALSQNPKTAQIAKEVYDDLAKIIEISAEPYIKKITNLNPELKEKYYKQLSLSFAHALSRSDGTNLARTIAESFGHGALLPFSNQSFFREFTRDLITKMNNEFIVRYYNGLAMVLNPSHGIIQIYEDSTGKIYAQDDLMLEAFNQPEYLGKGLTNSEILTDYLNKKFQKERVTIDKVMPGGNYENELGEIINTNKIEDYYEFKEKYNGEPIYKVYNKPRDLKPSEITFESNLINEAGEITTRSWNLFDTEPVRLRYVLNKWSKNGDQSINQKDLNILNSLAAFWKIKKDSNFYFNLGKKLNAWSQRNLHLLDSRRIMKSIDDISFKNDKGEIDVSKYFGNDTLINKRFDEVEEHYVLNNSVEIKNYSFKPAELMMPNIYASTFDNEGVSIKQILDTVDESGNNTYFESKVRKIYNVDTKEPINADLKLILSSDERPVYIKYVDNFPPVPVNTKMLRSIYNDELGETVLTRLNTKGEIVYTVPNNSRIIKEDDYDVVYLKIGKYTKISPLEGSEKAQNVSIISYDFEENLKNFIKSFKGGIQAIIPLMSNSDVGKVVSERSVKSLIEGEPSKLEYLPVDINNTTYRMFKRFSGYTVPDNKPYDSEWFNYHKDDIIKQLGLKKFISWQKSNEVIASRIPAQSMQSFMEMRNVSYVNTESNDGYVSIWQIWLQGSDFDIDKAYIMAYSFDKNGKYVTATDVFDYSSKEQLDAIESLPFPLGKEIVTSLNQDINQSIDISSDFEKIYNLELNNPIFNSESTIEQILHNNLFNLNAESIKSISNILRKIKRNSQIFVSEDIRNRPGAERILESLVKVFNIYNADESYVKKSNSIKNSVVSKIRKIISSPSNQLLANEPVSVRELHDAGDKAKKALGIEDSDLSMWDMLSPYKQQLDASIGKADVGIGANGLKVYYALSNYYNSYYNSLVDIGNIRDINSQEYLEDPKSFEKVFTLKTEVSPDVFENRTKRIFTIANTDVPTDYIEGIMNAYGYDELKKEEAKLSEESAALIASGFVSGATDNAKELVMAKINAVESLASMHLYLISLGYSIDDIAIYMNSKLAKHVANKISGNLFETSTKTYLDTIIEKYVEDLQKKLQSEKEKYKSNESPEIAESIQNIQNEIVEAIQFKDIYDGGQEFKVMASILKVNQKTSANINELNKFLGKLESAVFAREHAILGNSVIELRNPNSWNLQRNIRTNGVKSKTSIIEAIISANPLLRKMENATSYVTSILTKASDIEVSYIDNKGMTQTKQVSLVGGQFDFRYYMNPENIEYRNAAMEYYNLFKNTINIFDVIEGSPHFKAMIDGVSVMHSVLSTYSAKYNMAFNMIRDVVRKYSKELAKNEDVSHKFLNEAFPIDIDEFKLGKVFRAFDNFLISKWTKSVGEISKFRFSVKQLLQIAKDANAGVNSVVLFRNNSAKEFSNGDVKTYKDTSKVAEHVITVSLNSDEDFIVDLTSDYGIANFKILMEEVIFKILKTSKTSSLANTLKLSLVKNAMNIPGNQIVSTFNISELNSPINMEKYQELLTNFNDVDKKVENPLRIVNAENKRIAYKDLLYIYNLTVNNEMYGSKRLTPLFDDYIKHKDSIGRSYLDFSTLVDSGEVDIFEVDESLDPEMQNELKEYQAYSILHSVFNKKGSLKIGGKGDMLAVKNSHFVINTMSEKTTTSNFAKNATLESVLAILRNNNLIINFKCD